MSLDGLPGFPVWEQRMYDTLLAKLNDLVAVFRFYAQGPQDLDSEAWDEQSLDAREFSRSFSKFMRVEAEHQKLAGARDTGEGGAGRESVEGGLIAAATAESVFSRKARHDTALRRRIA